MDLREWKGDGYEVVVCRVGPLMTNCYVVRRMGESAGSRACLVVDPGAEAEELISYLERKGDHPEAVLLTHGHFDHTGAARALERAFPCPVALHPSDRYLLTMVPPDMAGGSIEPPVATIQPADLPAELCREFDLEFMDLPGHTPGGMGYRTGSLLFSGDTLFAGGVGRTDLPGGSPADLHRSLGRLLDLPDDTAVFPGHGPCTTIGDERADNLFLREVRHR